MLVLSCVKQERKISSQPSNTTRCTFSQLSSRQQNILNCLEVCALNRGGGGSPKEREIWLTVAIYEQCSDLRLLDPQPKRIFFSS